MTIIYVFMYYIIICKIIETVGAITYLTYLTWGF